MVAVGERSAVNTSCESAAFFVSVDHFDPSNLLSSNLLKINNIFLYSYQHFFSEHGIAGGRVCKLLGGSPESRERPGPGFKGRGSAYMGVDPRDPTHLLQQFAILIRTSSGSYQTL